MGLFDPISDIYKETKKVVKTGTNVVTNPGKVIKDTSDLSLGLFGNVVKTGVGAGRDIASGAAGAAGDVLKTGVGAAGDAAGGLLDILGIDMNILLIGAGIVGVIILLK